MLRKYFNIVTSNGIAVPTGRHTFTKGTASGERAGAASRVGGEKCGLAPIFEPMKAAQLEVGG